MIKLDFGSFPDPENSRLSCIEGLAKMGEKTRVPLNVVVLGASFSGLSVVHHFLDHTVATLGKTSIAPEYRLVIISPSTHIYWNIAAPRALVGPGLLRDSDMFVPIEPGLRRHKGANVVFIQGLASGWDTGARTIQIQAIGPRAQKRASRLDGTATDGVQEKFTIRYHALIIATGSSTHSDLLSLHGPHTKTMNALKANHERLKEASSIVIAGGGPSGMESSSRSLRAAVSLPCTGVEVAGQLATYLNQKPKRRPWALFSTSLSKQRKLNATTDPKRITLIMATPRALPRLPANIGRKAEKQLQGLRVKVIKDVRVIDTIDDFGEQGKIKVLLSNDQSLLTDVYIAATGVSPNTAFAPSNLLDAGGYINTNPQTLRVEEAGERVYAIGDCASYSANCVLDAYIGVAPLMSNVQKDLWAWELRSANPYGGSEDEIRSKEDANLTRRDKNETQLCPITRRGGVGILFGFGLPSLVVHLAKGRDYRVSKGERVVANGDNPY